jgi:hypothetical protein
VLSLSRQMPGEHLLNISLFLNYYPYSTRHLLSVLSDAIQILQLDRVVKYSEREYRTACRNQVSDTDNTRYSNMLIWAPLVTPELTECYQIFVQFAKNPKCTPVLTNLEPRVDGNRSFSYFNMVLPSGPLGVRETDDLTKSYFNRVTNNSRLNM